MEAAPPEVELERSLSRLAESACVFARLPVAEKIDLLSEIARGFVEVAPAMVEAGCRAKGIDPASDLSGEEWFASPVITQRCVRLLKSSLEDIRRRGVPRIDPKAARRLPQGGLAVDVVPADAYDRVLFPHWRVEVWLERGVEPSRLADAQASFYKQRDPEGSVALVLGAGNVASIPALDVLHKLFVEGSVTILKMSPVNAHQAPFFQRAFAPLIRRGFLAVVTGGAETGAYLANHALVREIHMTGSAETHDRIVWGPAGPERERRKRENSPLLQKKITSELGNVSPVVFVPGPWSDRELDQIAESIAGMIVNNASFNCNAAKLLVLPKGYAKNRALLERLSAVLAEVPTRKAYYPGAFDRFEALTAGAPRVEKIGQPREGELPWAIVSGLSADDDAPQFRVEPFCSVTSVVELGTADPIEFLSSATRFLNERVWGTLNATLFVHGETEKDARVGAAVESAIAELRYGCIALNYWPAAVYGLGSPPWGGHPSSTLSDVQSGIGFVHNTFMLERVEKSVLRGPLAAFPKPVWYPSYKTLKNTGRALFEFDSDPSLLRAGKVGLHAARA